MVLEGALGERAGGTWAAMEVGLVVPRQNGKGAVLEARELAGLFLFDEQLILHSAHEFKTASEAFRRVLALVEGSPDLSRRVKSVRTSHGDEGIELKTGQRLRFVARSTGSGRGFTGDLVILDEAFNLLPSAVAALAPTMAARPNPQLWYTSSAPLASSLVLKKLCRRGRAGASTGLAYFEWCARIDPDLTPDKRKAAITAALDDREAWAQANPALGIRITEDFIQRMERDAMEDEEFARERLGIYPDDILERLISEPTWDLVNDPDAYHDGPLVLVPDVNLDRTAAAITAVGPGFIEVDGVKRPTTVIETIEHRPGVAWLEVRCKELDATWSPTWAADGRSTAPVAGTIEKLRDAGIDVHEAEAADLYIACGDMLEAIGDRTVTFRRHASMDAAVEVAVQKFTGDAWLWDRRAGGDISPLWAATVGLWAVGEIAEADYFEL